jgi:hypothetical protein
VKELNLEIGHVHHFTWMESGPGAPSSSSPHYLNGQSFRHALKHDLAGPKRGNVFTAVYTGYMSNWSGFNDDSNPSTPGGTGGWNHYISVSGFNKSADQLEYADTAASTNSSVQPGPFGYVSNVKVNDFLTKDIQQNAVAAKNGDNPIQYFSDRVVLW